MNLLLVILFVASYLLIVLEHPLKVNKAASALLGGALLWVVYALFNHSAVAQLDHSLTAIAEIVFFLMGAMAVVEVVDAHDGFSVVTKKIKAENKNVLLWLISVITFFLSAVLDNLTTTIVMVSVIRKLIKGKEDRILFSSMTVIAANAGGAWSPIGDVTTTMLWIGGQIEAMPTIKALIAPSLVNLIAPLLIISYGFKGQKVVLNGAQSLAPDSTVTDFERKLIFFVGIGLLCFVPAFKELTHLPPFMGILFALGILWFCGDLIHQNKPETHKQHLSLTAALRRIDLSSILFFTGILLAVSVLEHAEILNALADFLEDKIGNQTLIIGLLGMLSAVIDNVPLVAASMGMYPLSEFPANSFTWQFLAYAAGTGGSILIIGSAAGIAAMGLEKIDFFWYVKRISGLALVGYLAGAVAYCLIAGV